MCVSPKKIDITSSQNLNMKGITLDTAGLVGEGQDGSKGVIGWIRDQNTGFQSFLIDNFCSQYFF